MKTSLSLDRSLAWYRGNSVRYLRAHISAPSMAAIEHQQPKNVAVVLDRSGSMEGPPLQMAKQAIEGIMHRLRPEDHLTLVAFDHEIEVLADVVAAGEGNFEKVRNLLAHLPARGNTNLAWGWLTAARRLAARMETLASSQHHVVILSDGQANQGEIDPARLGQHAAELYARGISTSTIGIGEGYSQTQLKPIANEGGGNLHDAQHPHEIEEVLDAEMDGLLGLAASKLELVVDLPDGVKVECLNRFPVQQSRGQVRIQLGMLRQGRERDAVLRLYLPAGEEGGMLSFPAQLRWVDAAGVPQVLELEPATIHFANGTANKQQPRDIALSERVAALWFAQLLDDTVEQNRRRDYAATRAMVETNLKHFARYAEGLPKAQELTAQLERVRKAAHLDWNERSRKEIGLYSKIAFSLSPDARKAAREKLARYIPD